MMPRERIIRIFRGVDEAEFSPGVNPGVSRFCAKAGIWMRIQGR